jgi:hypothetical protein
MTETFVTNIDDAARRGLTPLRRLGQLFLDYRRGRAERAERTSQERTMALLFEPLRRDEPR